MVAVDGERPSVRVRDRRDIGEPHQPMLTAKNLTKHFTLAGGRLGKPVVDRTDLTGEYDFSFSATTTVDQVNPANAIEADQGPSIFTALTELGFRLQPEKVARRLIVVEHAVKP